jgi:hypothetical protein
MKKITFFLMLFTATFGFCQNQTFTGVKTFNSAPVFKNLSNNNGNNKILTINDLNKLQWRDANSFTTTSDLQGVLGVGNEANMNDGEILLLGASKTDRITRIAYPNAKFEMNNKNGTLNLGANDPNTGESTSVVLEGGGLDIYGKTVTIRDPNTIVRFTSQPTPSGAQDILLFPFYGTGQTNTLATRRDVAAIGNKSLDDILTAGNTSDKSIRLIGTNSVSFLNLSRTEGIMNLLPDGSVYMLNSSGLEVHDGTSATSFKNAGYLEWNNLVDKSNRINFKKTTAGNAVFNLPEYTGTHTLATIETIAPASAAAAGTTGEIRTTANYIYWCIAPNTWIRAAGNTF